MSTIEITDIDAIKQLADSAGVTYAQVRNVIRRVGTREADVRGHLNALVERYSRVSGSKTSSQMPEQAETA